MRKAQININYRLVRQDIFLIKQKSVRANSGAIFCLIMLIGHFQNNTNYK